LSGSPFWPTLAALGFVLVNAFVIVLGTKSTARYEFGRNRARLEEEAVSAVAVPAAAAAPAVEENHAAEEAALHRQVAVSVAAHPAGKLTGATSGWWLVAEDGDPEDLLADESAAEVVAGPFKDRVDADWFALAHGLAAQAVYGARRAAGGEIVLRPSPEERAWLGELGDHLDRLGDEWDELLSDTDPLTTLVVEVAAALVEAGLPVHDCARRAEEPATAAGGVCLVPSPDLSGVLVSWRAHDRMSVHQERGAVADAAVQQVMNAAVADLLAHLEFEVESVGGATLVTAMRRG
jgi:hypothetical protein